MAEKSVLLAPGQLPVPEDLTYPLMASWKYDGNRCLIRGNEFLTRSMKPQPNRHLPVHLGALAAYAKSEGWVFDGELWSPEIPFNELQSIIRSGDVEIPPHVHFFAFDVVSLGHWNADVRMSGTFHNRYNWLCKLLHYNGELPLFKHVTLARHRLVHTPKEVRMMYEEALAAGFEGLILRSPNGHYKQGRATLKEGIIFKQKPFDTIDAVIIGYEQQRAIREDIDRGTNELGRTKRTHKAEHFGLADNIGTLRVRDEKGREFNCGWGRGWTHDKRRELWVKRDTLAGQWVEIRCMGVGEKDLPRMPQLLRFREEK